MAKKETTTEILEKNKLAEDVKFRKSEVELKDLEIVEKTILVDELRDKSKTEKVYTDLNKVIVLSDLLSTCTVDEGTTIGSETRWKASFDGEEQKVIKKKIFEIINKF